VLVVLHFADRRQRKPGAWRQLQVGKGPCTRQAWPSTHLLGSLLILLGALQRLPLLLHLLLQACQRLELLRLLCTARLKQPHPLPQACLLLAAAGCGLLGSGALLLQPLPGVLQRAITGAGSGASELQPSLQAGHICLQVGHLPRLLLPRHHQLQLQRRLFGLQRLHLAPAWGHMQPQCRS
jgi:hypothetical protein